MHTPTGDHVDRANCGPRIAFCDLEIVKTFYIHHSSETVFLLAISIFSDVKVKKKSKAIPVTGRGGL
jgi:hypothetical protein